MTDPATRPDLIDRAALREEARRLGQWTPHPDIADRVPFDPESGDYGRATTLARRDVLILIDAAPAAEPVPPKRTGTFHGTFGG